MPDDAPIPVDVLLTFPDISKNRAAKEPFRVKKTVWLGEPSVNPTMPPASVAAKGAGEVALTWQESHPPPPAMGLCTAVTLGRLAGESAARLTALR